MNISRNLALEFNGGRHIWTSIPRFSCRGSIFVRGSKTFGYWRGCYIERWLQLYFWVWLHSKLFSWPDETHLKWELAETHLFPQFWASFCKLCRLGYLLEIVEFTKKNNSITWRSMSLTTVLLSNIHLDNKQMF